jgi:GGDEF domain-containing protein
MRAPFGVEGQQVKISASAGISLFPEHGRSSGELIRADDAAMYRVKAAARDGYSLAAVD